MKIIRRLNEGECIPSVWWGYCWQEPYRWKMVIAPIGLNVVLAFARWCWQWVAFRAARWLDEHLPK